MDVPSNIVCVACGEAAHLASRPRPDEGFEPGESVVYLCSSCGLRLDVVLDEGDDAEDQSSAW